MMNESAQLSLLSVISLLSFFVALLISKFSNKIGNGILLDYDFEKPQAFHKELTPRSGGLACIISLTSFFILYNLLFKEFLFDYFILSVLIFSIGFLEDIKFKISPKYRLILMIISLLIFISLSSTTIQSIDLKFLNTWMNNNLFSTAFTLLCLLFIINGANLIDGFNGLLTIHLLLINFILFFINLNNGNETITTIITAQIVILVTFLLFNFPRAKMFLGDSGSYLLGSLVALNIINTNNLNPQISSFFFCILLFYLFFEVFFSFFRKLLLRKSPLKPDKQHLHMLIYEFLSKSGKFKDCNYLNSVVINLVYIFLILPAIFFQDNGLICKYWFFSLLILYIVFYSLLYSFTKKQ